MTVWAQQHPAIRATLNPALVAAVIGWAAGGYRRERNTGLPWPLGFVVPALILHAPTRTALPRRVNRRLLLWRQQEELLLEEFPQRCLTLRPYVRAGLRTGLTYSLLSVQGPYLVGAVPSVPADDQLYEFQQSATFVGRWFAHISEATIMAQLGVRL